MHRPWPYPRIIGHRGGGTLAPENTLAGIRKAAAMGFGAVEFDVMLSSDKVPVLIHDETLERTTNGRGKVADTPFAGLTGLDAGAWFGSAYHGETLPSFGQAGKLCVKLGLWANVEIKPARGFERETGAVTAKLARELWRGVTVSPLLSSFQPAALESARAAAPDLSRGFLVYRLDRGWREVARDLDCVSVHCDCRHLTAAQISEVHEAGFWLLCYTVNDSESARRLLSWGVDGILTDRLDLIPPDLA